MLQLRPFETLGLQVFILHIFADLVTLLCLCIAQIYIYIDVYTLMCIFTYMCIYIYVYIRIYPMFGYVGVAQPQTGLNQFKAVVGLRWDRQGAGKAAAR